MKKIFIKAKILPLFILLFVVSCNVGANSGSTLPKSPEKSAENNTEEYDRRELNALKKEIEEEANKENCTNPKDWEYTAMGSKPCGGPHLYVAYPKKIKTSILPKIEMYTDKEREFNKKYNIQSDCMLLNEPIGIKCKAGKAELIITQ